MDRRMKNNLVIGLFFCAALTRRRRGHTQFETSDTSEEAVKPHRSCSWQYYSWRVRADVGD